VVAKARKKNTASSRARKGWETRRQKAAELEKKKRAAAKKRAETLRKKAAELEKKKRAAAKKRAETLRKKAAAKQKRVEAGKRGYRKRLARERAAAALHEFTRAVELHAPKEKIQRVKASWHRAKERLEDEYEEDFDRYMGILEEIADEEGTEWEIAYGSTESSA
jgi:hypothetical protein